MNSQQSEQGKQPQGENNSVSYRRNECTLFLRLDEERYAGDAGRTYDAAESHAAQMDSYPVVYPEPYNTVGCGFGRLNAYVKAECFAVATEFGLDVETCDQVELIVTLRGGSRDAYEKYVKLLGTRVTKVSGWILNARDLWPCSETHDETDQEEADITDADIAEAKAAGFVVELGAADCPDEELRGRWWWTLTQPGWSGIESTDDDFATEREAWVDAVRHLRADPSLKPTLESNEGTLPQTHQGGSAS